MAKTALVYFHCNTKLQVRVNVGRCGRNERMKAPRWPWRSLASDGPHTAAPMFQNLSCVSNFLLFMLINLWLSVDRMQKQGQIHLFSNLELFQVRGGQFHGDGEPCG